MSSGCVEAVTSLTSDITLGRTGLRVSPIGLGAMTFVEDHGWGSSFDVGPAVEKLTDYFNANLAVA